MFKKSFVAILATLAMGVAAAAPNVVTGVNQNGQVQARGTNHILYVFHASGKTYYQVGGTQYHFDDASQAIKNKIVTSFGVNAITVNGVTYDAAKGSFVCFTSGTSIYWPNNNNYTEVNGDGCAVYNAAVAAGQAN